MHKSWKKISSVWNVGRIVTVALGLVLFALVLTLAGAPPDVIGEGVAVVAGVALLFARTIFRH